MSDNLLDSMVDSTVPLAPDEVDLLTGMLDSGAAAWVPEEPGEGIQGTVIAYEEIPAKYKRAGEEMGDTDPTVTVEMADGTRLRVLGFGAVLRRELRQASLEVGDTVAVKYFGTDTVKKGAFAGTEFKKYSVASRKGKRA